MKKTTENLKAVIYARYSSDNQREESIEGQLRECNDFAEKNGITVFASYIDRALSAKTDHRPEFQRLIRDSHKNLFDVVIVWKLDRFARNRYDSAHYKNVLKKNNVKVISATERISEGSEGIILESMLEGLAEYYSVELAEKIGRGLTDNALKSSFNGGGIPMGYTINKDRKFEIKEDEASIVREVFTRYSDGDKMNKIVKDLTLRGVKSSRGKNISIDIIRRMLKNRRYLGEYSFRNIVKPNAFPSIISQELFDHVQEKMIKNTKAPARHKAEDDYILTTKLRCGTCGAFMVGESGTSKSKTVYRYYKCANAKKKMGCKKKPAKKLWIENIVIKQAMEIVMDDEVIKKIAEAIIYLVIKESTKLPQLKTRLREIEDGIQNMLNAIQQGILTTSTKQRLEELETAKEEIQIAILSEELQKPELTKDHIIYWVSRFRDIDLTGLDSRKRLIDSFINTVYLYDDRLLIVFNYKDGTKTISLNDLEHNGEAGSLANMCSDLEVIPRPQKAKNAQDIERFLFFAPFELSPTL